MRIDDIMSRRVTTCAPYHSLAHAASLMWNGDCGCLPVKEPDSPRIDGIVTDRDICMAALFQGKSLHDIPVEAAMTRKVWTCRSGDDVEQVHRQMQNAQVRRLPVLDDGGALVGLVSLADIATAALEARARRNANGADRDVTTTLARISAPPGARGSA